jgi:hypothetical protein
MQTLKTSIGKPLETLKTSIGKTMQHFNTSSTLKYLSLPKARQATLLQHPYPQDFQDIRAHRFKNFID